MSFIAENIYKLPKKMHWLDKNQENQSLSKDTIFENYNNIFPNLTKNYDEVINLIPTNYTTFVMTFKNLTLNENSYIQGSRIGIWAQNILMKSSARFNASHLGWSVNRGPGSYTKQAFFNCGAPGACYGGYGGEPGSLSKDKGKQVNSI